MVTMNNDAMSMTGIRHIQLVKLCDELIASELLQSRITLHS